MLDNFQTRKWIYALLALCVLGCQRRPDASLPQRGGRLRVAVLDVLDAPSPLYGMSPTTSQFVEHVTPPLGRLDPQGRLQLYLASRSIDSGGSIDFTLRRVRWEDGVPVTPRDLIETARLVRVPQIASPDRRRTDLIAGCTALDDSTLRIEFRTLYGRRVRDALLMPVAAHALPPDVDYSRLQSLPFTNRPLGCGPYRVTGSTGTHLGLVRHDGAGFPPAWIDSVDVDVLEPDAAVAAYLAGRIDVLADLPAGHLQAARRRPSRVVALVGASYLFMGWNLRDSRFDLVVRRAVARGVDLERLRRTATFGQGDPARGPLTALQGFADTTALLPYDPKRARRELDAAGWRDTDRDGIRDRRGAKLAFHILVPENDPLRVSAAQAVSTDLRQLGIGVAVRTLPIDQLLLRLNQREFEAFIGQWFVSGALDFDPVWRSESGEQLNFGGYASSTADSLLTQMQHELLGEEREQLLRTFQKHVYADQPYLFLFQNPHWLVLGTAVRGAEPNVVSAFWNLPQWWLAPAAGGGHIAAGGSRRR